MIKRRPVSEIADSSVTSSNSIAYQAWVLDTQHNLIIAAREASGLSWPEWAARALERLQRMEDDSPDEVEFLLSAWPRGRKGKTRLSFRVLPVTLSTMQALAETHKGTIQGLIAHCFFIEALATS